MKDISEKRLSDYMAEQIADEILSGRIPGGSQLKQEELAEAFEASRIPIREAFQILENQGLIIRLATRRITVTELDKLKSLKHSGKTAQLEELLMTSGLSGEVQPAEAMCDLVENEYIKRLLRNASDSYIRFALSTGHYADKIKEEKDKMTELLENGELKKVEKSLDVYFKLLVQADERRRSPFTGKCSHTVKCIGDAGKRGISDTCKRWVNTVAQEQRSCSTWNYGNLY